MSLALQRLIDAAQGRIPADLLLTDIEYLNVFSNQWRRGEIAICDGKIVGLESGLQATRTYDGRGLRVVPGFIDAHVHVESSLLVPAYFEKAVLPRGTTSAICDPHELANVQGVSGIQYFLDEAERLRMNLRVMLSSCVPATHLETNGGGIIDGEQLAPLLAHPRALGLAEMMNVPGVLHADPAVLKKIALFAHVPMDGHCPLVRGQQLSAYAAAGISSCHESSQLEEAAEKLTKGIAVWIREGSVAKDLDALVPLLNLATSTSLGFCTDDRNPLDIAREGHIDHLVRKSIRLGVAEEVAYRCASWSVARHYGLKQRGAIAPGYAADLVLLEDSRNVGIRDVLCGGKLVSELELGRGAGAASAHPSGQSVRAVAPAAHDLLGPSGQVHVIGVHPGSIITARSVEAHDTPGVARLSVLERYGRGSKPSNGYVRGFGDAFRGAIGSSVGHDSHNLIGVGGGAQAGEDMRTSIAALIAAGGGFCVVRDGQVRALLPLPFGGLMSERDPRDLEQDLRKLHHESHAIGCELPEPFLQLAFLSLPVIPSLKLTDRGLVDVDAFQFIDVRAS